LFCTSQKLALRLSKDPDDWILYLAERFDEYGSYRKWIATAAQSQSGTLLWEYAKTIAAISGIEEDAVFNISLGSLLISSFKRWNLRELLGESKTTSS
jgi:hypothetical protein